MAAKTTNPVEITFEQNAETNGNLHVLYINQINVEHNYARQHQSHDGLAENGEGGEIAVNDDTVVNEVVNDNFVVRHALEEEIDAWCEKHKTDPEREGLSEEELRAQAPAYTMVDGHGRLRAHLKRQREVAKAAGVEFDAAGAYVTCKILTKECSTKAHSIAFSAYMNTANQGELNHWDMYDSMRALMDKKTGFGLNQTQAAAKYGRDRVFASRMMKLKALTDQERAKAVKAGWSLNKCIQFAEAKGTGEAAGGRPRENMTAQEKADWLDNCRLFMEMYDDDKESVEYRVAYAMATIFELHAGEVKTGGDKAFTFANLADTIGLDPQFDDDIDDADLDFDCNLRAQIEEQRESAKAAEEAKKAAEKAAKLPKASTKKKPGKGAKATSSTSKGDSKSKPKAAPKKQQPAVAGAEV